jgi:hypothetical protein
MRRLLQAALFAVLFAGCAHNVSDEERLDRDTQTASAEDQTMDRAELAKVNCADTKSDLDKAHNENRPETERLQTYMGLYQSLKKRTSMFEEAMTRNPDLAFQEGSEPLVAAKELCIQQTADVKVEFENYVRELVEVPTVQEVRGGNTYTVARLDFGILKQAINVLSPEDKDAWLTKVSNAEKRVKAEAPPDEGSSSRHKR